MGIKSAGAASTKGSRLGKYLSSKKSAFTKPTVVEEENTISPSSLDETSTGNQIQTSSSAVDPARSKLEESELNTKSFVEAGRPGPHAGSILVTEGTVIEAISGSEFDEMQIRQTENSSAQASKFDQTDQSMRAVKNKQISALSQQVMELIIDNIRTVHMNAKLSQYLK